MTEKQSAAMGMKKRGLRPLLFLACGIWPYLACEAAPGPAADLIITNAKVWTVDKSRPSAQAVAIVGERIVAVGSNADVGAWRGAKTQNIDAQGKLLLPGFDDSHVHFISGGSHRSSVASIALCFFISPIA